MFPVTRAIALDGPSGSGKSTVARRVAGALSWRYVDTGATYRAVTLAVLMAGVPPSEADGVLRVARSVRVELSPDPNHPITWLNGTDVSAVLRGADVTAAVSAVSAVPQLRAMLVDLQRRVAGSAGAVVEGRDVGTTVLPAAAVKVYLEASPQDRARRRAADVDPGVSAVACGAAGDSPRLESAVAADLARRDSLDAGRAVSPLLAAPDAVRIDSSGLDADDVVARVLDLARAAGFTKGSAEVQPGRVR